MVLLGGSGKDPWSPQRSEQCIGLFPRRSEGGEDFHSQLGGLPLWTFDHMAVLILSMFIGWHSVIGHGSPESIECLTWVHTVFRNSGLTVSIECMAWVLRFHDCECRNQL